MSIRIAFTGPESTGKTTLCALTAEHYDCPWVPEFAREYLNLTSGHYELKDLDYMASQQVKLWHALNDQSLVFYDTEMTVFSIWATAKFGVITETIKQQFSAQHIDHYFLCAPDIPWEYDPLRENPINRNELFTAYYETLEQNTLPFTVLNGSLQDRKKAVIKVVDELLRKI